MSSSTNGSASQDPFSAKDTFQTARGELGIYRITKLEEAGLGEVSTLPYSVRVLLEAALRNCDGFIVEEQDVKNIAAWGTSDAPPMEIPFQPSRVVLQDFTGVPAVVDLAAMRSAMIRLGGDPKKINPLVPCDLVVDHSVQVDRFASPDAMEVNVRIEFERNQERYEFLRWGQQAFDNFSVIPPATGIVHQVNLEYLAKGVLKKDGIAFPDSLVGTDSHTTMINGMGVVGWGVGGIEAEGVMLGQPVYMLMPEVVGMRLFGEMPEGATATDLVLTAVQMLRAHGVVGKFVEFFGEGIVKMSLPDRATLANMAPEYGATMGFFPVDDETLAFMKRTGRTDEEVDLVERYYKEQGMFRTEASPAPRFTSTLELDMGTIVPSLAGPKRPQDRITLTDMQPAWKTTLETTFGKSPNSGGGGGTAAATGSTATEAATATAVLEADPGFEGVEVEYNGHTFALKHGSVVIAAITSCTNTSNPSVMVAAGLLAKKANERGLNSAPWVKTSLAPGSRVVTDYLVKADLQQHLDALGFALVGYGCTTCIGNSGPLPAPISKAINEHDLVACSVLSGNRNFEGRIGPDIQANYLASPPLVVAYALAGTTDIDLVNDPLGQDSDGSDVFLSDLWPSGKEIADTLATAITPEMFRTQYATATEGSPEWQAIATAEGDDFQWQEKSTYIQEPPFFIDMPKEVPAVEPIAGARVLATFGDSVTTDHISPAGAIASDGPAGKFLQANGVEPKNFNSFGSRRGNDRVMTRGTFANIRIRNQLAPGTEGGVTRHLPDGEPMSIYDAAMQYKTEGTPLIVLTGKEYGTGSSRDWAAKGACLLGVRAVIAASYERIHRSNLVGMGVLPLQFEDGQSWQSLGLTGEETFDIPDLGESLSPRQSLTVIANAADGSQKKFQTMVRIDTPVELDYYKNGGILQTVLRKLA